MAKYASEDFICVVTGERGADKHHIYTRKANPELKDKQWNAIPICHKLHEEWHKKGTAYMASNYLAIAKWLKANGWAWDAVLLKWWHDKSV